jgi:hypothetical protein
MIVRQIARHEEGFVEIGLGDGLHRRGAQGIAAHRQVADVVLVDPDLHFPVERLAMEPRGLAEGAADQRLGHAVIDDEVEADLGQRNAQLARRAFEGSRFPGEVGPQVDDGNGLRVAHSAACRLASLSTS